MKSIDVIKTDRKSVKYEDTGIDSICVVYGGHDLYMDIMKDTEVPVSSPDHGISEAHLFSPLMNKFFGIIHKVFHSTHEI